MQKTQKIPRIYFCGDCDYTTSNKKDYNKHLMTPKHNNAINCYADAMIKSQCLCGKTFNHCSSLYRHKKRCVPVIHESEPKEPKSGF